MATIKLKEPNEMVDAHLLEYEEDIYLGMRARQDAPCYYIDANYFELQEKVPIMPKHRFILVEWMMDVVSHRDLSKDALWLAVFIVDRFLTIVPIASRSELQLLGAMALCIGEKFEDRIHHRPITYYLGMCVVTGTKTPLYTHEQGVAMECRIIKELDGRLSPPTSLFFLRGYTRHMLVMEKKKTTTKKKGDGLWTMIYRITRYFAEASLLCAPLLRYSPNVIAAGCFYLARRVCKLSPLWPNELAQWGGVSEREALTAGVAIHTCCRDQVLNKNEILTERHTELFSQLAKKNESLTSLTIIAHSEPAPILVT